MLDHKIRPFIDPPLNAFGRQLARLGVSANSISLIGLAFGLLAALGVVFAWPGVILVGLLGLGRLADGLDGAVARATHKTDFGGYLDIFCDFIFYAAIPLAFILRDPAQNALVGAFLLASFYINAASFLGYAIMAEKRGMTTTAQGQKSLYYAAGLLEGTETIAFFVLIILFPAIFVPAAWVFAALCVLTALARVALAWGSLRG